MSPAQPLNPDQQLRELAAAWEPAPAVGLRRPALLLAAALVVIAGWSLLVASKHLEAQRERDRSMQFVRADRDLHELELVRWRVLSGDLSVLKADGVAGRAWSGVSGAVERAAGERRPALRKALRALLLRLRQDRRIVLTHVPAARPRFAPELAEVDALIDAEEASADAAADRASAGAWRLTAVSGAIALLIAGLLLAGFARARRLAGRLRTDAARAEGEQAALLRDRRTGLANRSCFEQWLQDALVRGSGAAAVLIDIDDFKTVNDSLGHPAGDRCLIACGERLRAAVDGRGRVARVGGDEFAVLLEEVDGPEAAETLARVLLDAIGGAVRLDESEVPLTASAGVALATPGDLPENLLRCADTAAHAAKARGAGRVEVYTPAMHQRAVRRLALRAALVRAVEREELDLAYQPVVDLEHGMPTGVEALLRWRTADGEPVPPADFIPVAEASGLIVPLGAWVLERACRDVAPLGELTVAVNVSAVQLRSADFTGHVAEALLRSGLPARRLVLELTESAVMDDVAGVQEAFGALQALGVQVAIDDFGTGFSSLASLAALPVDLLKLDRSFVAAMASSEPHEALVGGVVSLADRVGLPLCAEGVETAGQLEALRALGCRYAQGYHLGRPGPLAAVDVRARSLR